VLLTRCAERAEGERRETDDAEWRDKDGVHGRRVELMGEDCATMGVDNKRPCKAL